MKHRATHTPRPARKQKVGIGGENLSRTFSVVIHRADPDEGGYWAEVSGLPGCVTQGQTVDETIANAREAIVGHLEALSMLNQPIPVAESPAIVPVTVRVPQHA